MRVIIAGSRSFTNFDFVDKKVEAILKNIYSEQYTIIPEKTEIILGGAKGVDDCGEYFAKKHGYSFQTFYPNWDHFGRAAAVKRNEEMAVYASGSADIGVLIAFWDGKSKGTKSMIFQAQKLNLKLFIVQIE